jgi:hypothetical protein
VESGLWADITKKAGDRSKELFKDPVFRKRVIPKLRESGKRSAIVNKEKGNLTRLAEHRKNLHRQEWAAILSQLPHEFTTAQLEELTSSHKVTVNIMGRTNWVKRVRWGIYEKTENFYNYKPQSIEEIWDV